MDERLEAWLQLQCQMLTGVQQATVIDKGAPNGPYEAAAIWPARTDLAPVLSPLARLAIKRSTPIWQSLRTGRAGACATTLDVLAYPLAAAAVSQGAIALVLTARTEQQRKAVLQVLNWGTTWLALLLGSESPTYAANMVKVLDMISATLGQESCRAAEMTFVTEVAALVRCERVSLGWLQRGRIKVTAASNCTRLDERANLVSAIAAAMEEATDQDDTVVYPPSEDASGGITRAHAKLAEGYGSSVVCTIPLTKGDRLIGALTLEGLAGERLDPRTQSLFGTIASLAGPLLDSKRRAQRSLPGVTWEATRSLFNRLLGSGHVRVKVAAVGGLGALAFLALASGEHRIDAQATLQGTVQRAVVAPFDGYVAESSARAGDRVDADQVLCRLEDRELELERLKWANEKAKIDREYREALAGHERAKVRILGAQLQQAEAQIALLDEKLARTRVTTPFAGMVTSGDLTQSLGAPVERGEVLFEVAPLDAYRIALEVDERDIAFVQPRQPGTLALSGMPSDRYPFRVKRVTPIAKAAEGRNFFRVEAQLDGSAELLRPGMMGVGKITVGRRKLLWLWTHRFTDWLTLMLWSL